MNAPVPAYQPETVVVAADNIVTECRNTDTGGRTKLSVNVTGLVAQYQITFIRTRAITLIINSTNVYLFQK